MKKTIRHIIILIISLGLSTLIDIRFDKAGDNFFINTLYTLSGIMFSIGLGLTVTFNPTGVKNENYIRKIRDNLNDVLKVYIIYFSITTIIFITEKYLRDFNLNILSIKIFNKSFKFNFSTFSCLILLYSIFYYILNFLEIQKLNNDIFDKLNK